MRQRRKNIILQPIKWIVLLGAVGTVTVTGLSAIGLVEWNSDNKLDSLMFWKSTPTKQAAAAVASPTPNPGKPSPTPAGTPAVSATPAATAAQSPVPSATPTPGQVKTASAGVIQVVSQAASLAAVSPNERAWLDQAGLIKLEPGKLFSFNAWLAEASKGKTLEKKEDELSHIASLIHEAALRAGMKVGERYPHPDIPANITPGFDVDFQVDKKDFTFYNSLEFPVTLGVIYSGEIPTITWNGAPAASWKAPILTVSKENFNPDREILTDFTLIGKGEVRRSEGSPGTLAKVYADWKNDGNKELLIKDFYAPRPIIIARPPTAEEMK